MLTQNWLARNTFFLKTVFYCYLIFVFVVTQIPPNKTEKMGEIPFVKFLREFNFTDKIVHFGLFFILAILYFLPFRKSFLNVFFVIFGISFLIEILQLTLPFNRSFDWFDLLANGLGTIAAIALLKRFFSV